MKALVTGATGFVGSHVATTLLARGYEVRALVRPARGHQRRAELPAEIESVWGDVQDVDSLRRATKGCQAVFHVAAYYELWSPDPRRFYEVNVRGTERVLDAARQAGVERTVYTSSVATVLPGRPGSGDRTWRGGNERGFAEPAAAHSHYKRSKILAERVVMRHAGLGWPVVVVNPSTPVGTGDVRPTPTGKIVLDFLRGRMPAFVNTGLNLIDVEDVAEGHVLAFERGTPGERYILGNQNVTLREMLGLLALEARRPAPRFRVPLPVALAAGAISEVLQGRVAHRSPAIPFEGVRMAATPMYYDSSRAQRELGLPRRPIAQALRKSAEWFQQHGYI
ncbi:MAG: hopanoid-associated sugar epimerase [Chloroflexota bacterium]